VRSSNEIVDEPDASSRVLRVSDYSFKFSTREVGAGELGIGEVGVGELGAGQVGALEDGAGEVGVVEEGATKFGVLKVCVGGVWRR